MSNTDVLMWSIVKNNKTFFASFLVIFITATTLLLAFSKTTSFVMINGAHTILLDSYFYFVTYFGNGLVYFVFIILFLFFNIRHSFTFLVAAIIQALIVQFLKHVVFPDALRPMNFISNPNVIHTVEGVSVYINNSFPSGHTATAFCIYAILSFISGNRYFSVAMVLLAAAVGYSRIYLAQHFLIDVYFGSIIGLFAGWFTFWLMNIRLKSKWHWMDRKIDLFKK
jgi:membrane-associated phospholipid phosphatase